MSVTNRCDTWYAQVKEVFPYKNGPVGRLRAWNLEKFMDHQATCTIVVSVGGLQINNMELYELCHRVLTGRQSQLINRQSGWEKTIVERLNSRFFARTLKGYVEDIIRENDPTKVQEVSDFMFLNPCFTNAAQGASDTRRRSYGKERTGPRAPLWNYRQDHGGLLRRLTSRGESKKGPGYSVLELDHLSIPGNQWSTALPGAFSCFRKELAWYLMEVEWKTLGLPKPLDSDDEASKGSRYDATALEYSRMMGYVWKKKLDVYFALDIRHPDIPGAHSIIRAFSMPGVEFRGGSPQSVMTVNPFHAHSAEARSWKYSPKEAYYARPIFFCQCKLLTKSGVRKKLQLAYVSWLHLFDVQAGEMKCARK